MNWPEYRIESVWGLDEQTPAEIGERFLDLLHRLGPVSPIMNNWILRDYPRLKQIGLTEATPRMTALVEKSVQGRRSSGLDDPAFGYNIVARGLQRPSSVGIPQMVDIAVTSADAGDNSLRMSFGTFNQPPDPSVITYETFRGAVEATAMAWPCPWALAYVYGPGDEGSVDVPYPPNPKWGPQTMMKMRGPFALAWIAYLSPHLCNGLTPPSDIQLERTPGGGAILSSVQGVLDVANPEQLRRAQELQDVLVQQVGIANPPNPRPKQHPIRIGPY